MTLDLTQGAAVLLGAFALDLAAGEPPARLHPVVGMGKLLALVHGRRPRLSAQARLRQFALGSLAALALPALWAAAAVLLLGMLADWPVARFVAAVLLLKSSFSVRMLGAEARAVKRALERGDLEAARARVGGIVSRDTTEFREAQVTGAAVATVAENTTDSIVAPLFWYAVLGVPGALAYRAINTADAMVGYRGEWEWQGKFSARLDDVVNFIPARITVVLLLAAGVLRRSSPGRALRVLRRDGQRTSSPNAGLPMATVCGLLGIELVKDAHYRMGEPVVPLEPAAISRAWHLALSVAVLWVGLLLLYNAAMGGEALRVVV